METGGKQYRVAPGDVLQVEKLPASEDASVELDRVLLVAGDDGVQVGSPSLPGAKVVAKVLAQGRSDKVRVFKYKNKTRYRRTRGHRQPFTRLAIQQIVTG